MLTLISFLSLLRLKNEPNELTSALSVEGAGRGERGGDPQSYNIT